MRDNTFGYIKNNNAVIMREEYLYDSPERTKDFSEDPPISYDQALSIAQNTISDLNFIIDDQLVLCYGQKAIAYIGETPTSYGWEFVFTRINGGLQSPYRGEYDLWSNSNPPIACAPWEEECLFIFVDENGLYSLDARGLGKHQRFLESEISYLPFEDIQNCVIKQIKMQHPRQEKGTDNWSIEIKRFQLCSVLVNDIPEQIGYMMPAWETEYTLEYSTGNAYESFTLFTYFSAMDGSYIEPRVTVSDATEAYSMK